MRKVDEWVGKTDDTEIPKRVKLRVWLREGGKCWLTGRYIQVGDAYDFDHKVALCNGGEHRESNLAPALRDAHRKKTAADVKLRAKCDRIRARHVGITSKSRNPMPGSRASNFKRRFDGSVVRRDAQ